VGSCCRGQLQPTKLLAHPICGLTLRISSCTVTQRTLGRLQVLINKCLLRIARQNIQQSTVEDKIAFLSKADHPRMRAFNYAWSLPVMWQSWRSRRSICHIRKPHATCKLHGSMFYRTGVIADLEVLNCGNTLLVVQHSGIHSHCLFVIHHWH